MPYKDVLRRKEYNAAYQKKWGKKNLEKRRAIGRKSMQKWRDENPEIALVVQREWRKNNRYKELLYVTKYKAKNPEKAAAHRIVLFAKKDGTLIQLPCEICGNIRSQAHHEDYSKPLEVIWLCQKHHSERHRSVRT